MTFAPRHWPGITEAWDQIESIHERNDLEAHQFDDVIDQTVNDCRKPRHQRQLEVIVLLRAYVASGIQLAKADGKMVRFTEPLLDLQRIELEINRCQALKQAS